MECGRGADAGQVKANKGLTKWDAEKRGDILARAIAGCGGLGHTIEDASVETSREGRLRCGGGRGGGGLSLCNERARDNDEKGFRVGEHYMSGKMSSTLI